MLAVTLPYMQIIGLDGKPLDGGYVYFGKVGLNPLIQSNQIQIYWDESGSQPIAQPVRTTNGYPIRSGTPAKVYSKSSYSMSVYDRNMRLVFYSSSASLGSVIDFSESDGAGLIGGFESYTGLRLYSGDKSRVQVIGLGIFGDFYLDPSDTTSQDNGGTVIVDGLGRRWKRFFDGSVNPRWFGAKGNGTTDDTASIAAADATGYGIEFGAGVYPCKNLYQTSSWSMHKKAWLIFNGDSASDWCVKISGSGIDGGNLNIHGGGSSRKAELLAHFTGTNNVLDQIKVSNYMSPSDGNVACAVKFSAAYNTVLEVVGIDCLNTGNANVSSPQLVTIGGGAENCVVELITARNVTSGVVAVATGSRNRIGDISLNGALDNGLYLVDGYTSVRSLRYAGDDEPIVSIGGSADVGTVMVDRASGANAVLGLNNNGLITIGEIILRGPESASYIVRSRGVSSVLGAPVRIGRISGEFYGVVPFYVNELNTCRSLSIDSVDVTHFFRSDSYTGSWCRFDGANELHLGEFNIKVIDTTNDTPATTLRMVINPALSYPSTCGRINVSIFKQSDYSPSARAFFADNFFQPMMAVDSAVINAGNAAIVKSDGTQPSGSGIYASNFPQAGTWKKGQIVFRTGTNANSTPGWVCTTEGTPGVWKTMANVAA